MAKNCPPLCVKCSTFAAQNLTGIKIIKDNMKKAIFFSMVLLAVVSMTRAQEEQRFSWLDTSKSFHERAVLLCNELTLREKVDQLGNNVNEPITRDTGGLAPVVILPAYQY